MPVVRINDIQIYYAIHVEGEPLVLYGTSLLPLQSHFSFLYIFYCNL